MKFTNVEKLGTGGMMHTAPACPACWPLFAGIGSAIGLGFLPPWEGIMMNYVFPPFVVLAMAGSFFSFRTHKKTGPLVMGVASGFAVLLGFYVNWQLTLMYVGICGLLAGAIRSHGEIRRQAKPCRT